MRLFMQQRRVLLLLAVGFAALVLAGCGGGEENPADGGGGGGGNNVIGNNNCTSGAMCKQVTIGTQVWMAENLNVATSSGSWCYDDDNSNCAKYGRLYDWETAKTVCPTGWHLPSRAEWRELAITVGGTGINGDEGTAGTKLKSKAGWDSWPEVPTGTDNYGFSALPGGLRHSFDFNSGDFYDAGWDGLWWTATEYTGNFVGHACYRKISYYFENVNESPANPYHGYSVRCLRD